MITQEMINELSYKIAKESTTAFSQRIAKMQLTLEALESRNESGESDDIVTAIEKHINSFDTLTEREIDLCSYSFKEGWFKALRKPGESDEDIFSDFEKWFVTVQLPGDNSIVYNAAWAAWLASRKK